MERAEIDTVRFTQTSCLMVAALNKYVVVHRRAASVAALVALMAAEYRLPTLDLERYVPVCVRAGVAAGAIRDVRGGYALRSAAHFLEAPPQKVSVAVNTCPDDYDDDDDEPIVRHRYGPAAPPMMVNVAVGPSVPHPDAGAWSQAASAAAAQANNARRAEETYSGVGEATLQVVPEMQHGGAGDEDDEYDASYTDDSYSTYASTASLASGDWVGWLEADDEGVMLHYLVAEEEPELEN